MGAFMTWYAVYDIATGNLKATGTKVADELPAGLAAKSFDYNVQAKDKQWDSALLDFVTVDAPKQPLLPFEFKNRFTLEEHAALIAASASDAVLAAFLDRVNTAPVIRLDDAQTIAGVQYIVAKGLVSSARGGEVLA